MPRFYWCIKVITRPYLLLIGFFGMPSDQLGIRGLILAVLTMGTFRNHCCQSPTNIILRTDFVSVLPETIHPGVLACGQRTLEAQRPIVPTGPLGVSGMFMLTGERWRGREERSRTAGGVAEGLFWSPIIPHFVLDPLESPRLNKYTLLRPSSFPRHLPPPPFCFSLSFYPPSLISLSRDPLEGLSKVLFSYFHFFACFVCFPK